VNRGGWKWVSNDNHARNPLPFQRNHSHGDIQPLDLVSATRQQSNESAIASGADIESLPTGRSKSQRVLMLPNAIPVKMRFQPLMSDGIVAVSDLSRVHG